MAITRQGAVLTDRHRAAQLAVRAGSLQQLVALWRAVDPTDLTGTIDTFVAAAVILTGQGFDRSGLAALAYYRLFRRAEGVTGSVAAAAAPGLDRDVMVGQIRGAALRGVVDARRAGASVDAAHTRGFVRVAGEVAKLVLTGGRRTLIGAVDVDPRATGWSRVTSGDPCAFCRMLASRGPVFRSQQSADFETHGACACTVEPSYSSAPTAQARQWRDQWDAAQAHARDQGGASGTSNDALNNFRRFLGG